VAEAEYFVRTGNQRDAILWGASGPEVSGYLSGNGLLTAVMLGRIAGMNAARQAL
jgi:hypothetical protein